MRMVRLGGALVMAAILGLPIRGFAGPGSAISWVSDFRSAKREAKAQNKLLLVSIHATWCMPCRLMERTTLRDPSVTKRVGASCVAVHLDGDRDGGLIRQWPVMAYPTDLFFAPDGRLVGKVEGYVDAAKYVAALTRAVGVAGLERRATDAMEISQTPKTRAGALRNAGQSTKEGGSGATSGLANARLTIAEPITPQRPVVPTNVDAPLALDGYCPVTMIAKALLVAGHDTHQLVHAGRRYLFTTSENRNLFAKRPNHYVPAEDGHCVVTWAVDHRWVRGHTEVPALYGEAVYLFADKEARQQFLRDPERFVDETGRAYRTSARSGAGVLR